LIIQAKAAEATKEAEEQAKAAETAAADAKVQFLLFRF